MSTALTTSWPYANGTLFWSPPPEPIPDLLMSDTGEDVCTMRPGNHVKNAPCELKANPAYVLAAMEHYADEFKCASIDCRMNVAVILAFLKNNPSSVDDFDDLDKVLFKIPYSVFKDSVKMFRIVEEYGMALGHTHIVKDYDDYKDNPNDDRGSPCCDDDDVVCAAVNQDGYALQFASKRLRKKKAVVLLAVKQNGLALQFASKGLRKNKDVVMAAVSAPFSHKHHCLLFDYTERPLMYAAPDLRVDHDIVVAAVQIDGVSLKFTSYDHCDDADIAFLAIKEDMCEIEYVSERLRRNSEFVASVIAAGDDCGGCFESQETFIGHLDTSVLNDHKVVLGMVGMEGSLLRFASQDRQNDKVVVLAALKNFNNREGPADTNYEYQMHPLYHAGWDVINDKPTMHEVAMYDITNLKYASHGLKTDFEFMISVMKSTPDPSDVFEYNPKLRADASFMHTAKFHVYFDIVRLLFIGHKDAGSLLSLLPIEIVQKHCLPALLKNLTFD